MMRCCACMIATVSAAQQSAHSLNEPDHRRKTAITPEGAVHAINDHEDSATASANRMSDSQGGREDSGVAARPFDGSTQLWPTPEEMDMDVWAAPEVPLSTRHPMRIKESPHAFTRVFEVLPAGEHFGRPSGEALVQRGFYHAQKVAVVDGPDAAAWAPRNIPCDSAEGPEWNGLASDEGEDVTTEQCW